jgi:2-keto-4-pentenoate hydratase/2-oxohepta-3-ene-1,7-dioic acid hydratase in catechol pathway
MRFATLEINNRRFVAAVSADGTQYCEASRLFPGFEGDMQALIERHPSMKDVTMPADGLQPLAGVRICAPIPEPRRNVFCVGKNYHEHAKEFGRSGFDMSAGKGEDAPPAPVVFTKPASTVVGQGDDVLSFPEVTQQMDYEVELGVIIGRTARGISKAEALNHVWGYTIINDVTARDLQQKHRQWFIGKALDTYCPMGPFIVTADEVDVSNLTVQCWINGELRQNANTSDLIFDVPTIIETLSAGMTLRAGDVIATGTPAGVGIGFKPPRFMKSGDEMKLTIGNLGTLTNRVK